MKTSLTNAQRLCFATAACGTALLLLVAAGLAADAARGAASRAAPACSAAGTQVWLGLGGGGGFAGGVGYPLEFSNVGHRTCTLYGYPGVSATRAGRQVGPAASRVGERHSAITLAPGATAHASLTIHDWGAVCGKPTTASGLKVYPPGQRTSKTIDLSVAVCAHRGVLGVGAVRAGVGIPGYISQ
ncbi:MAG TPA: DUF4232 domain-containing protein [Solirubrobacteraceae bacterium]|nr:DUF4232 domain-containing protein [Solirubrobacteraceae bacterium]